MVAAVVVLYAGGGLALPLGLHWRVEFLVEANVLCTFFAALTSLVWFAVRIEAAFRRCLVEWTTELRHLDAAEFEWLVGELFRREGWQVKETGRQDDPDGNIDLEITRDGRLKIVQCKRWSAQLVGVEHIRAFVGLSCESICPGTQGPSSLSQASRHKLGPRLRRRASPSSTVETCTPSWREPAAPNRARSVPSPWSLTARRLAGGSAVLHLVVLRGAAVRRPDWHELGLRTHFWNTDGADMAQP